MTWDYRKAKKGEITCLECAFGNLTERWWSGRISCTLQGYTAVGKKMTCRYAHTEEKEQ